MAVGTNTLATGATLKNEPDPGRRHPELPDAVAGTRPEKGRTDNGYHKRTNHSASISGSHG